jgi:hypothetical protein
VARRAAWRGLAAASAATNILGTSLTARHSEEATPTGYLLAATQPADLPIRGAAASLGGMRSLATTWVS